MKKELAREITREINYELIVGIEYKGKETGAVAEETIYSFLIIRTYTEGIFNPYYDDAEVYVDHQTGEIVDMQGTEGEEEENALRDMVQEILKSET
jgi:formylmethanofuran dehydrogenase subunit D